MDIRTQMMLAGAPSIPKPESWTDNAANTCILHDGKVTYLGYCQHKKLIVVSAAELIAVAEPDWDYEDRGFANEKETMLDYLFFGLATVVLSVNNGWIAVKKLFTRARKINL
jgi:hypothetical protein